MPAVTISLREMERFEAGSLLLSYLYYPRIPEDDAARELHFVALCHAVLRYRARRDPQWASAKQMINPRHAFVDEAAFKRGVRQSVRRGRDRMLAGRMAIGPIAEWVSGQPPALPKSTERLSLAELAKFFLNESRESDPINVVKRAWSQSLPVIHQAAALEIYGRMAVDRGRPGLHADVQHIEGALEEVLDIAKAHERAVLGSPIFHIDAAKLIHFELVEKAQE